MQISHVDFNHLLHHWSLKSSTASHNKGSSKHLCHLQEVQVHQGAWILYRPVWQIRFHSCFLPLLEHDASFSLVSLGYIGVLARMCMSNICCSNLFRYTNCFYIATEHQHTTGSLSLDPVSAKVLLIKVSPPAVDHILIMREVIKGEYSTAQTTMNELSHHVDQMPSSCRIQPFFFSHSFLIAKMRGLKVKGEWDTKRLKELSHQEINTLSRHMHGHLST